MDAIQFYRSVSEKLCQGDILERVPLLHLKDLPATITKATLSGKKQGFEQGPPLPDAPNPPPALRCWCPPSAITRAAFFSLTTARSTSPGRNTSQSRLFARLGLCHPISRL